MRPVIPDYDWSIFGVRVTPEQLQIVTSKGYQGSLKDSVRYTSAGMMKGLNISYAMQLIAR
jgi:hypothetical protein